MRKARLPCPKAPRHARAGQAWPILVFLIGFTVLLIFLSYAFLLPALRAAAVADPDQKKQLSAQAALMLTVILVMLLCGMILTFRAGRYFFPRGAHKRQHTKYVDAWAEAGKRMEAPDDEERPLG